MTCVQNATVSRREKKLERKVYVDGNKFIIVFRTKAVAEEFFKAMQLPVIKKIVDGYLRKR